jgi:putative tryptophan/tyrosine transport system substrate-binding protein
MQRREFIAGLGAAAWPVTAYAQPAMMPVIGFVDNTSLFAKREFVAAFRRGLAETGYFESRNVMIEYRWAEGQYDRLPALVSDLVRRPVTVIVACPTNTALAAKAATTTIPIVFQIGANPVEIGLVTSLSRPGGNLTGVVNLNLDVAAKRLELLHELVPAATSIAFLANPTNRMYTENETKEVQSAARVLGLRLIILTASSESDIETAFATLVLDRADAVLVGADTLFLIYRDQLVAQAARHAVPVVYPYREFAHAGGLMSYGSNLIDAFRQVGLYTGRILSGEKPADLPVQQAVRLEMNLNLKTAKALGLTIPETLLATADEVIQ